MKQEEKELSEEGDPKRPLDEIPRHPSKKASEIEQIDDSQLPQSIKDLFKI